MNISNKCTSATTFFSDELTRLYEDKGMIFYTQNGVIMAHKKMGNAVKNSENKRHEKLVKTQN